MHVSFRARIEFTCETGVLFAVEVRRRRRTTGVPLRMPEDRPSCRACACLRPSKGSRRLHEPLGLGYKRVAIFASHGGFAMLNTIAPFFIVDDLAATLAFYQSK